MYFSEHFSDEPAGEKFSTAEPEGAYKTAEKLKKCSTKAAWKQYRQWNAINAIIFRKQKR